MHTSHPTQEKNIKTYKPLIAVITSILIISGVLTYLFDPNVMGFMRFFMGTFFLIFGFFKFIDLKGFVDIYVTYDLLAMRSRLWAYIYPFIELTLGIIYITGFATAGIHLFTAILLIFGGIGVWRILQKRQGIQCACLGAVIKLPMSTVTLIEDFGMGIMALIMFLIAIF